MRNSRFITGIALGGGLGILVTAGVMTLTSAMPSEDAMAALAQKQTEQANIAFIRGFFEPDFTDDQKYEALDTDYDQHNPVFREFNTLNNTGGQEEFKVLRQAMQAREPGDDPMFATPAPGSPEWTRIHDISADGDTVTVISQRFSPNPLRPGEFYEHFWFDQWRMKDGKLFEHWDPQTIPDDVPDFLLEPVER